MKKENAKILELACGPGNISQYVLNKRPDFELFGIDLAPGMIKLAKQNNPTAKFKVMDVKKINSLNTRYDGIICGFCLPYFSKTETIQLIKDSSNLLAKGGILYL